jgi:hypothetical protein
VTALNSHNGVALFERDRIGFATATGVIRDSIVEGPALALPSLGPAAEIVSTGVVVPDPPITPGDEVRIDVLNRFEFGDPFGTGAVKHDTWTFRAEGAASAVNAALGNEPANALVRAFGSAALFVDPIHAPVNTAIGQIVIDAIRPLTSKEAALGASINFVLLENDAPVLELAAGAPSAAYDIVVGRSYKLQATYYLDVPFGTDPPFLVELGATLICLPGDSNCNGSVDAADYVYWRKNDSTPAGYDSWRANFGRAAGSGTGSVTSTGGPAAVPEPATFALCFVSMIAIGLPRMCRSCTPQSPLAQGAEHAASRTGF